jgi:hypothetical protein
MSLSNSRRATAEHIFSEFDFIYSVEDAASWTYNDGGNVIERTVFLTPDSGADTSSLKSNFSIRFEDGSNVPVEIVCNLDGEIIGELSGSLADYVVSAKFEPEPSQKWFHGTSAEFDKFDAAYIGQGNDELGSGFYFTNDEETAHNYALMRNADDGYLITAEVDIKKPLEMDTFFSHKEIKKILEASPNLEDVLWNFGDLNSLSKDSVLNIAVGLYANMNGAPDALAVLNTMNNDFFNGDEATFLAAVTEVTGYDGLYREKGGQIHTVVWNPEQIKITDVRQVMKDTPRL